MRVRIGAVVAAFMLLPQAATADETSADPEWLILQVDKVKASATRPGTQRTWDSENKKSDGGWCETGLGAFLTVKLPIIGGAIAGWGCGLLKDNAPDDDPRAPDLMLRLVADGAEPYLSGIVPNRYMHDFAYSFLVPVAAIPRTGIKLQVVDQDGKERGEGELMASFRLTRDQLVAAQKSTPVLELSDDGVEGLELIVKSASTAPHNLAGVLDTSKGLATVEADLTAGYVVEIGASGSYEFASFEGPAGPDGVEGYKQYNLAYGELANGPHAAAVAVIGADGYIVGSCKHLVLPSSGRMFVGINDDHAGNNEGTISFKVRVRLPTLSEWQHAGKASACPAEKKAPAEPQQSADERLMRTFLQSLRANASSCSEHLEPGKTKATFKVAIGPDGTVRRLRVEGVPRAYSGCIGRISREWKFAEAGKNREFDVVTVLVK